VQNMNALSYIDQFSRFVNAQLTSSYNLDKNQCLKENATGTCTCPGDLLRKRRDSLELVFDETSHQYIPVYWLAFH
jgi:hypothetical protein